MDTNQINAYENFFSFIRDWTYFKMLMSPEKIIALFTGNQKGKTGSLAHQYVARVLGIHGVPIKNCTYWECSKRTELLQTIPEKYYDKLDEFLVDHKTKDSATFNKNGITGLGEDLKEIPEFCPECDSVIVKHIRKSKVMRFCSETLPGDTADSSKDPGSESQEVKNTQYPEFKKWLPPILLKKDITHRKKAMVLHDINDLDHDIVIDFVGYNQTIQSTAGTQRMSVWYDEEPKEEFREEQLPRLVAEDGDECYSLTPANFISWLFDEVFEKASIFHRTKAICDWCEKGDKNFPLEKKEPRPANIERTNSPFDIAVFMAATDDNPTLQPDVVEILFSKIDDPDVYAIRRYGIFKQVSGRIFKSWDYKIHFINSSLFEDGIPIKGWTHARGIDYHPQEPWAIGCISLSPQNEAFIWYSEEFSPEKLTTKEIAFEFAKAHAGYSFHLNKIDPESEVIKKDKKSIREDLNKAMYELRERGYGLGGFFSTWNTKGEVGRDSIHEILKNAKLCKRPFNNEVIEDGVKKLLPTLWVLNSCKLAAKCLHQWRWSKRKNEPEQAFSHICMVFEAIFKERLFIPRSGAQHRGRGYKKFQGGSCR